MTTARVLLPALVAGALALALDRPPPLGRIVTAPAAPATTRRSSALPNFALFGWVSPPVESTTLARYAELAGAGMNLAVPALGDSGRLRDNRARLDAAWASGVRCLTWDRRMYGLDPATQEGAARLDTIVADMRDHPGFLGWYLGDEPAVSDWGWIETMFDALRARDPEHPPWNNLLGRGAFPSRQAWIDYLTSYLDRFQPAVLCDDHYDFLADRDKGLFVENAAGLNALARGRGIPFWSIVLLVGHGPFRVPTAGELRWQVAMLLAYGARGVGYFTYWTPPPDPQQNWRPAVIDEQGRRTSWYDLLAGFNPRVRAAGETLATVTWLATTHAGSTPVGGTPFVPDGWVRAVSGRAALGMFADSLGGRLLLVVNADSAQGRTLSLVPARSARAWRLGPGGAWEPLPRATLGDRAVTLALDAGDFALLRLEGPLDGGGPASRVRVAPVPASGTARIAADGATDGARLEILDGAGRRVWTRRLAAGASSLEWDGGRDGGGTAPAGIYFVRLEDDRGVAVARLHWLGKR